MKRFFLFLAFLSAAAFLAGCENSMGSMVTVAEPGDEPAASGEAETSDSDAAEPVVSDDESANPDSEPADSDSGDSGTDDFDPADTGKVDDFSDSDFPDEEPAGNPVFNFGPYIVNMVDVNSNKDDAPRNFRIYEPTGAEGPVPVIHFLHGFQLKYDYYDNIMMQLSSHGFLVVSSQSDHGMLGWGGDTSIEEANEVVYFIGWLKENLAAKVSV